MSLNRPALRHVLLALLAYGAALYACTSVADTRFIALSYHDVRDDLKESPDRYTVDTGEFVKQLAWLREHGYQPVSLQQILDARAGRAPLPDNAVLLTFDDGYRSFYTRVFPLLKLFGYPALLALVGRWMEATPEEPITADQVAFPRRNLMSWDEVREVAASGLVEVASHSFDLHRGILANPQGNTQPAATAYRYDPATRRYESDAKYLVRVREDLTQSVALLKERLRLRPRAMVWPYGAYNEVIADLARELGMAVTFNLGDGRNDPRAPRPDFFRTVVTRDTRMADFIRALTKPTPRLIRLVHVDLDYVYDPDPQQQEKNLSRLLDRLQALNVNTVYLQAFADPDGDGAADAVYFPNRHLPMRADLFNRVAWQLRTRVGVAVYAWMPVLAFRLPQNHPAHADTVESAIPAKRVPRLSPFSAPARQAILEIYEDLAKHAPVAGLLFHDDAMLSDYEDASPAALRYYRDRWGLPGMVAEIRRDPVLLRRWAALKGESLDRFTLELAAVFRRWQPAAKTARNLFARAVLEPESEIWLAQSFPRFLQHYDYTAVMAMPYMEGARRSRRWLAQLVERVKAFPDGLDKTVFELQSKDWRTGEPLPGQALARDMRLIHTLGARHFGYYPDDFHHNRPEFEAIFPAITLKSVP
jgi:biofilm PGA synthesis lipoprotein PgaB